MKESLNSIRINVRIDTLLQKDFELYLSNYNETKESASLKKTKMLLFESFIFSVNHDMIDISKFYTGSIKVTSKYQNIDTSTYYIGSIPKEVSVKFEERLVELSMKFGYKKIKMNHLITSFMIAVLDKEIDVTPFFKVVNKKGK